MWGEGGGEAKMSLEDMRTWREYFLHFFDFPKYFTTSDVLCWGSYSNRVGAKSTLMPSLQQDDKDRCMSIVCTTAILRILRKENHNGNWAKFLLPVCLGYPVATNTKCFLIIMEEPEGEEGGGGGGEEVKCLPINHRRSQWVQPIISVVNMNSGDTRSSIRSLSCLSDLNDRNDQQITNQSLVTLATYYPNDLDQKERGSSNRAKLDIISWLTKRKRPYVKINKEYFNLKSSNDTCEMCHSLNRIHF